MDYTGNIGKLYDFLGALDEVLQNHKGEILWEEGQIELICDYESGDPGSLRCGDGLDYDDLSDFLQGRNV